jgi:hypothetical protein
VWEQALAGRPDVADACSDLLWNSGRACIGDIDVVMGWMARREVGRSMLFMWIARNSRPWIRFSTAA